MKFNLWRINIDITITIVKSVWELLLRNPPFISFFENQSYIYYKSTFLYKLIIDIPLFSFDFFLILFIKN